MTDLYNSQNSHVIYEAEDIFLLSVQPGYESAPLLLKKKKKVNTFFYIFEGLTKKSNSINPTLTICGLVSLLHLAA